MLNYEWKRLAPKRLKILLAMRAIVMNIFTDVEIVRNATSETVRIWIVNCVFRISS